MYTPLSHKKIHLIYTPYLPSKRKKKYIKKQLNQSSTQIINRQMPDGSHQHKSGRMNMCSCILQYLLCSSFWLANNSSHEFWLVDNYIPGMMYLHNKIHNNLHYFFIPVCWNTLAWHPPRKIIQDFICKLFISPCILIIIIFILCLYSVKLFILYVYKYIKEGSDESLTFYGSQGVHRRGRAFAPTPPEPPPFSKF